MNCDIQLSRTHLPEHLILEQILPRLPVKSLFRFKSVCKDWLNTLSSRDFATSYLKFSFWHPRQFLILANDSESYNYVFYLLSYKEPRSNLEEVVFPLDIDNSLQGTIDIVSSCNGLVCLYRELNHHRTFYLWNPATRQCREIDQNDELEEIEPFMFTASYGFGYASSIDDYKIVAIFTTYTNDFSSHLYVYSLKSGKWKRITCALDHYRVSTIGIHKGVLIDNQVFWPLRFRDHAEESNQIAGFNLVDEQLKVNPWMNWLLQESEANLPLLRIRGCLSLCRYTNDTCFDVWMLKKRDDWNSWEKLFFVNVGNVDFIHFSKNGKCLVHNLKQIKVIERGQEVIECSQQDNDSVGHYNGHVWEAEDYVESFISPL